MEIDCEKPYEEVVFSAAFWQGCEREAASMLRGLTGIDDA